MSQVMTREEAIRELVELEMTYPRLPVRGREAERARETSARLQALYDYLFQDGPAPAPGWRPTVPPPEGEELERLRQHWADTMAAADAGMEVWDDDEDTH